MIRRMWLVLAGLLFVVQAGGEDWPCWRYDAGHTGATPEKLPKKLHVQWVRDLPPCERAWPDDERLEFDIAYEPIVAGRHVYVGSPQTDSVMAFDAVTGEEKWKFFTGGPVRFAPAVAEGLVYAGSDDGYVYCLDGATGAEKWRFRAALSDRKVIGNTRMISVWPVRGAPVVAEGTVYFAAGIWPFEGVSVYALDAKTGAVVWINDNCDVTFMLQPHHSPAFSGIAPQGYLAVAGDKLLVPNGRTAPACFDKKTGKRLYFEMDPNNRFGDYRVSVLGDFFVNPGALYRLEDGQNLGSFPSPVVMSGGLIAGIRKGQVVGYDFAAMKAASYEDNKKQTRWKWESPELWRIDGKATDVIQAGDRLYGCGAGGVFAIDIPRGKKAPELAWENNLEGERGARLAAANGRLYVSTLEGSIYCFGEKKQAAKKWAAPDKAAKAVNTRVEPAEGAPEGYKLVIGKGSGSMTAGSKDLHVVAVEPSAENVAAARRSLDESWLYGAKVAVLEADLNDLPPYFASRATVLDAKVEWASSKEQVAALYERLRPYGGEASIKVEPEVAAALEKTVKEAALPGAELEVKDGVALLRRAGPLPGAGDWTQQYADSANSVVSKDTLVRAPLGLLWFGGSSNKDILPRHGHGPSEQVVGGRLFIEGPDMIRAMDVYTGRVLWQVALPEIGKAYDNTSHQPGANALGSNFVSVLDGVYVAYGDKCLRLDPATGKVMSEFGLPAADGAEKPDFGYIGVYEDVLVAGSGPMRYDEEIKGETWNAVASKRIVALNRHTGEPMWTRPADAAFRHNAISLGAGKVFCIDNVTSEYRERLARRGITLPEQGKLLALDIKTGQEIWRTDKDVFGTWLGYSAEHDLLLQAGRASRDMLKDEANDRMIAYKAGDGKVVWDRQVNYNGPCLLHGDTIIAQEKFFSLLTGESLERQNPLTGERVDMNWNRQYGCNSAVACQNLVTFRSAAAGFFDLRGDGGTGNLGGFKSGCTSNLIAANGVLNAPDYTRTCTCSYQNQTSLAFIYTPQTEMWTYNAFNSGHGRIKRVGLNFGAPGDRRDEGGTLWLDYPSVGGKSPEVVVAIEPAEPRWYRYHSLRMSGAGPAWVVASGAEGLRRVRVTVEEGAKKAWPCTVRLYFAEPGAAEKGGRVFDVALQGKTVLTGFDVAGEAGGAMRGVVKEFKGVPVKDAIEIALEPKSGLEPVLSGVEIVQE
ncbi:MAG: PQQ-binding-like beta-propeller repeat protein [Candidatus Hydrogenedentes bacterium]|nr:PQQ-binding-like beta-propeller repeat protein [Candidatus Hydrogenedentota bacterium]